MPDQLVYISLPALFDYPVPVEKETKFKELVENNYYTNVTLKCIRSDNLIVTNPKLIKKSLYFSYIPETQMCFYLKEYDKYMSIESWHLLDLLNNHNIINQELIGSFQIGFFSSNYKHHTLVSR